MKLPSILIITRVRPILPAGKNLRRVLRSEVDRSVWRDGIIIVDSLNSIKGESWWDLRESNQPAIPRPNPKFTTLKNLLDLLFRYKTIKQLRPQNPQFTFHSSKVQKEDLTVPFACCCTFTLFASFFVPEGTFWIFSAMFLRRAAVTLPYSRSIFSAKSTHDLASAITEMNKEMEFVFGEPPSGGGFSGSLNNDHMLQEPKFSPIDNILAQDSQSISDSMNQNALELTHVDSSGEAQMVDVSPKENSKRTANATCKPTKWQKEISYCGQNSWHKWSEAH
ncbi:conserved hypothetical protein [Ricinus communis]|uniref:Uncharacterized protein n=1 Tax=Ricinus communis TaxID=3988 RepID=B9SBG6_RICCO|nr:conserved hypothetical protein [Ricinus communis]